MKQKAIFLDRDGVINSDENHYYVYKISDFVLTPHLGEALKILRDKGFLLIMITNQGGIAKGEYAVKDVEDLYACLQEQLIAHGVDLTEMYFCPHHPKHGKCLCRKPLALMVQKAMARFNIDPAQSYFIGDRPGDVQTAEAAGVKGILVERNTGILETAKKIQVDKATS